MSGGTQQLAQVFSLRTITGIGVDVTALVYECETALCTPTTGAPQYIRMQSWQNFNWPTYRWNDDIANYDPETTEHDPRLEARWLAERQ